MRVGEDSKVFLGLADGCPKLQSQQCWMLRQEGPSRPRVHSKNALLSRCLALATVWAWKLTEEDRENRGSRRNRGKVASISLDIPGGPPRYIAIYSKV